MKKIINFCLIFALFALFALSNDQWGDTLQFEFQFKSCDLKIVTLNFSQISSDYLIDQELVEHEFQRISLPGATTTQEIGKPELPVFIKIIAAQTKPIITVKETEVEVWQNFNVYPFQPPKTEETRPVKFAFNKMFYQQSIEYPNSQLYEISEVKVWRGLKIYQLKIFPMIYNPLKKEVKYYKKIRLDIQYAPPKIEVSPRDYQIYQGVITNFDKVFLDVKNRPGKYLIVVNRKYQKAIKPLINWYERKGVEVKILVFKEKYKPEALKELIRNDYKKRKTDWVLLVGNYQQIPAYLYDELWDPIYSDTWYGQVDGNDFYTDIAVGRLPVNNKKELENIIKKIIEYESNPVKEKDDWLLNSLLIAHEEDYPEKYTQCLREIAETTYPLFSSVKFQLVLGGERKTNQDITEAINSGQGIVNYRGHGDWNCWYYWNGQELWDIDNVKQLKNQAKTPVVFNIACNNHQIDKFSLGQAWLKKYPGGAVASLGATAPSYTEANHVYNKFIWLGLGQQGIYEIGWLNNFASAKIIDQCGNMGEENTMMYCWYGDPAMEIWTDIPKIFEIKTEKKSKQLKVYVKDKNGQPVSNALVCLYREGSFFRKSKIYFTGYTDQNGELFIKMARGKYFLTVSEHNYLPKQQKIKQGFLFFLFWL